jgi:murein DD-endopeptidase MepM/ murein hydrolase activator NlpD
MCTWKESQMSGYTFLNSILISTSHGSKIMKNDGSEETIDLFELVEATFDASTKTINAELPTAIFSNTRNSTGDFEAIITLAPTPGINRTVSAISPLSVDTVLSASIAPAATASDCKAASIQCPLSIGCEATSPFNPARKHPVTGEVKPHTGVDCRAPNGSDVASAADGAVETSKVRSCYGETIVIRHTDGSATLYAHLEQRNVAVGTTVTKGQSIATSDNSGTSTAPHLHFEYVPNGQIFKSKNRIDPDACIDALASGSITVRDNGSAADDAFQVFMDNNLIGSTEIGASNTLAVNNLIPGNHQLKITAIIAPDNVGTYEITLNDGLTFSGGGASASGILAQGASTTFTIAVPQQ